MTTENEASMLKQLTIRVPADVHRAVKIRAAEMDVPIGVIVESLLRQFLNGKVRVKV